MYVFYNKFFSYEHVAVEAFPTATCFLKKAGPLCSEFGKPCLLKFLCVTMIRVYVAVIHI